MERAPIALPTASLNFMSIALPIASLVISLFSVIFTGVISWDRWHQERRPNIQITYEEYGGFDPDPSFLEIANKGDEDLARVEIELRETLEGISPVLTTLFNDSVYATGETRRVDIGTLDALETKRIRVRRNSETIRDSEGDEWVDCVGGDVDLYVYCTGRHWLLKWHWRVSKTLKVEHCKIAL